MAIKLYGFPGTRSNRVQWLLEELEVPYELEKLAIFEGEHKLPPHLARHPHGLIPAAEIDGQAMIESGAMLLHLADQHGALAPKVGTPERARYYQFVTYASTMLDAPTIDYFFHTTFFAAERRDAAKAEKAKPVLETALRLLGKALEGRQYLTGSASSADAFSAADVAVGYDLFMLKAAGLLDTAPEVAAYFARLAARPAFQKVFGAT